MYRFLKALAGLALTTAAIAEPLSIVEMTDSATVREAYHVLEQQRSDVNDWMVALTEVPAPPFGESPRAANIASKFAELPGLEISIDDVGNVLALRPGAPDAAIVVIAAHMDTVFPAGTEIDVAVSDNVFAAPGVGDNTRGVAMLYALMRAVTLAQIETEKAILFVATVGEEGLGDLRGTKHLLASPLAERFDALIAIDGSNPNLIVSTAVGSRRFRVTIRGSGGHSWGDFGHANPHHALASIITQFTANADAVLAAQPSKGSYSVGRIGGGTAVNAIPFESWMEVDMRSADPVLLVALETAFRQSVVAAIDVANQRRVGGQALSVDLVSVGARPAGSTPLDSLLIRRALTIWRSLGLEPVLTASSTDANAAMAVGLPAVTISRGGISVGAHGLQESWTDHDTLRSEQAALLLLLMMSDARQVQR
ncbi:MAG: M20/M25/M40 family metallo-hydrolase [Pseudomonadota bacterium]